MRLGKIFSIYAYMYTMYGVVLINHNILNRISNVPLIIVLEEIKSKGNVVLVMPPYYDRSRLNRCSMVALATVY